MTLSIQDKKSIVLEVNQVTQNALSAVIADIRGITVDKMTELRKKGRDAGVYIRVVRNTLLHRIVEGTQFDCLKSYFIGPTLIAFSMQYAGAAARLFKEFMQTNNIIFEIKAAAFEGKLIKNVDIDLLAMLPTYEEALSNLMSIMKEAAAGKLVRTLSALCHAKEVA